MAGRLAGKVAIITGGSRGIGQAMGRAMALEGARVVLASRKLEAVEAAAREVAAGLPEGSVFARACHVGDAEQCRDLVAWASDHVGAVDVLVNNAGTNPFFGPLLQISEEAFDKTFEVNLKSAWRLATDVARRLVTAGRPGAIISVASVLGMRAAPFQGAYGMTKAGLISLTQTLATELGAARIRVNAIAPGLIDTRLAGVIVKSEALTKAFTDRTALKRVGRPEEVAGLAVFLASDESSYITGHTFPVDAGYVAM
ncbi:MAG: short-chain dehydrogenase [Deltaproteobacteria bacterium HGW-Deltaproteobacteria-14]|jgi:NAD(P)-dependent dehydrogenase (short-subunit alcohol dehydrogenase family)|nr:MAG: short-chain dehydrogenase [Deltaproteobacteria bacterium HGW-Deltaproteobacteria-14]